MNIILDSNIFFSALIRDSTVRKIITKSNNCFLFPLIIFEEFKKYKEELIKKSKLDYSSFREAVINIMKHVKLVKDEQFENKFEEALSIMKKIDEKDTSFIACALAFDCPVWSDDPHFKRQNKIQVFTTKDMLHLFS